MMASSVLWLMIFPSLIGLPSRILQIDAGVPHRTCWGFFAKLPIQSAIVGNLLAKHACLTAGAHHVIIDIAHAIGHLPTIGKHFDAVFPFENRGEMVVDVTPFRIRPNLPATTAVGRFGWFVAHQPHGLVEAVNMLFHDVITGKPGVVQPVSHLIFDF